MQVSGLSKMEHSLNLIATVLILFSLTSKYCNCFDNVDIKTLDFISYEGTSYLGHGEGPIWDNEQNILYWVDVSNRNIYKLFYNTGDIEIRHIDYGEVNIVSPVRNSDTQLLVTIKSQIFLLDWTYNNTNDGLRLLSSVDTHRPRNVLNEGKVDAYGRFWAGTKGRQSGTYVYPDEATLYMISEANYLVPEVKIRPVSTSNGLVWSNDNKIFYYIDSDTYQVVAFDYDLETSFISKKRVVIDVRDYGFTGIPDGMTIDSDGNLWIAIMFNGTVIHVDSSNGEILDKYEFPVKRTTSVMWGGPDLDILFVSSSSTDLSDEERASQPLAGSIFYLTDTGYKGVPINKFIFNH